MKLEYVQTKSHVSNIFWGIGNGYALSHSPTKKIFFGHEFGDTFWMTRGDSMTLAVKDLKAISEFTTKVENELLEKPEHVQKIRKIFDKKSKIVLKTIKSLREKNLSKASDKELLKLYNEILKAYYEIYHYGEPIAFAARNFGERIQHLFEKIGVTDEEFNELATPIETSFLQKERLSLFQILLSKKDLNKNIKLHTNKFEWVPYDYGVTNFTEKDFKKEIKKLKKKSILDIRKEFNFLFNYSTIIKEKHQSIIKKYKVDKKLQSLIKVIQNSTYLLDYKKEIFTKLHWYSTNLFSELERRFGLTRIQVKHMLPHEIIELLAKHKLPDKKRLDDRNKGFVFHITKKGEINITEGKKAKEIMSEFEKNRQSKKATKIKGRTVSKGYAKGSVRVLKNSKECNQMKHGEILVATMTSPDYVIAIRKAAAIVTDEGGITCHAAIVARELGIPCIVGTHIATQALKNGDMIEVDANKGVVRKL